MSEEDIIFITIMLIIILKVVAVVVAVVVVVAVAAVVFQDQVSVPQRCSGCLCSWPRVQVAWWEPALKPKSLQPKLGPKPNLDKKPKTLKAKLAA